ncbi:glycoside hydrolase superfamily [Aspergillus heterothallicus]
MVLPQDFLWGYGTASYQIEGAVTDGGRGRSIWDTFCSIPGKIADGTDGRVACDSYHRTAEDIALLKEYGAKAYRFSISWPRIIPLGGRNDPVNQQGLQHYVRFVDDLLAANIIPLVTLYQWDLPQALHDIYGGPLDKEEFVADFANYARVMFEALGSKVKHWTTFTEPHNIAATGYNIGTYAPGRCSDRRRSPSGDGSREPWIVGHSILLAHATAVKTYREKFNMEADGKIRITLNDARDLTARDRYLDFTVKWFADPIYYGHYPQTMIVQLGDRLPSWTPAEIALVHGSSDFFALDYYTSTFIKHRLSTPDVDDYLGNTEMLQENFHGESIGPETDSAWLRACPQGLRKLLNWINKTYNGPDIYILENGTSLRGEDDLPIERILQDDFRCDFYSDHINEVIKAWKEDGINIKGYMAWSFMDNFEWNDGFQVRFGVTYVDYQNDMKRHPKRSAKLIAELFTEQIGN